MTLLVVFILFLWVIWLQEKLTNLKSRVDLLERNKETTSPNDAPLAEDLSVNNSDAPKSLLYPDTANYFASKIVDQGNPPLVESDPASTVDKFLRWLEEDFMMKLGAGLLLLAFGWFVSYAFANNWIGEFGRIMLGLLLGASIMVGGVFRVRHHFHQGGVLLVLGSSTILMTVYAARELYGMFDPYSALSLMLASVALVAYVSVQANRRYLALTSLVLAGIAPFLTAAGAPNIIDSSLYLLVIVAGTLWVVYLRGWSVLTFASLIVVTIHHLPFLTSGMIGNSSALAGLWFGFLFTLIFLVASLASFLASNYSEEHPSRIYTALGSAIYLILWLYLADPEWLTLALACWALIFAVGGFLTYQIVDKRYPFYIYAGTSLLLLVVAVAEELSGPALTIAYIIKFTLLVFLSAYVLRDEALAAKLSFLLIIPAWLSLPSVVSSAWRETAFQSDLVVLLLMLAATGAVGWVLGRTRDYVDSFAIGFYCVAGFYAVTLVWLVTHSGIADTASSAYEIATMFSLVIYTVTGITLLVVGQKKDWKGLVFGGNVLIGLVVCRLIFIDLSQMEIVGKIITFMVIGALLISTAFIMKKPQSKSY